MNQITSPVPNPNYSNQYPSNQPGIKPAPLRFGSQSLSPNELKTASQQIKQNKTLRVIPLGGLGEVGKNLNVIEYGQDAIIVDAGFMLGIDFPGINYAIPELTYIERIKSKIRGYIFTHGHLDHVGAMPYILPMAPAPCYGSRFTLDMLERVVKDRNINQDLDKRVLNPDTHETLTVGPFEIELVRITHSIPDACAVVITTPEGKIVHTGDFKLDPTPLDGKVSDLERLRQLGMENVLLLMSDSTNCEDAGRTPTEAVIEPSLQQIFSSVRGRIIISAVSTNINRIQMIINAVVKTGRKVAIDGRSMLANIELAVKNGFMKIPAGTIVAMRDCGRLADHELAIVSTGHQGELNSVLLRMASGEHKFIKLKPMDTVILSSSVIPGNEKAVVAVVDRLMREGARVFRHETRELDNTGPLHVSGHARRDELSDMLGMIKPRFFMPIHGEYHHQLRHAQLGAELGLEPPKIFVLNKGEVLELAQGLALSTEKVPAGALLIDQTGAVVSGVVIKDRQLMTEDGIVVTVLTIDRKNGQLLTSPDIITRGFIYIRDSEKLLDSFRTELRRFAARRYRQLDANRFKQELRDFASNFLYRATQRSPIIIPVVNIVGNSPAKSQSPASKAAHLGSTQNLPQATVSGQRTKSNPPKSPSVPGAKTFDQSRPSTPQGPTPY